jgi:hypothetical protein
MRKLVLAIIALFVLFTIIRAYTDVRETPVSIPSVQAAEKIGS